MGVLGGTDDVAPVNQTKKRTALLELGLAERTKSGEIRLSRLEKEREEATAE